MPKADPSAFRSGWRACFADMVDCHTHVFPPKVAPRLAAAIGREFGRQPIGDGSVPDLLKHLDQAGLTRAICFTAALKPDQMIPANSWMIRLRREEPRLIPLGTIHPHHPDWPAELERLDRHGIRGLKIHPDLTGIALQAPDWVDVWRQAAGRFVVLIHMGPAHPGGSSISLPSDLAKIMDDHPQLRVIAAHLGGVGQWEDALATLAGRDLFLDTSCCGQTISPDLFCRLLNRHSPQRVLFGSDYPLFAPKSELDSLNRLLTLCGLRAADILRNGQQLAAALQPG